MMNDAEMSSDELAELEAEVRAARPASDPRLRGRVLAVVADELVGQHRRGWWNFAAGLAAALLIGLNLSLAVAPASVSMAGPPEPVDLDAAAHELSQAVPGLSPAEARRELFLLRSGARLPLWVQPRGSIARHDIDPTN